MFGLFLLLQSCRSPWPSRLLPFPLFPSSYFPWIQLSYLTSGSLSCRATELKSHCQCLLCWDTHVTTSAAGQLSKSCSSEISLLPATFASAPSSFWYSFKSCFYFHILHCCVSSQPDKGNFTFRVLRMWHDLFIATT